MDLSAKAVDTSKSEVYTKKKRLWQMKIVNKYELNMSLNPSINGWYKETLTVEPISWGEAIRKNCTSDLRKKGVIYKLTDLNAIPR